MSQYEQCIDLLTVVVSTVDVESSSAELVTVLVHDEGGWVVEGLGVVSGDVHVLSGMNVGEVVLIS